ncbi:Mitochondrial import inner membrane translocase subunit tim17 [Colletotrichum siamense]|uniref:Mitochondrial import inner membrane translocase subunit tim17 n=1 Tax=Colletotrichum siamense TaxID=690259 RepID=UPI001872B9EA|nr:Mitochondrial import inner membrane translocase subunit tim17 [Colletotrichum siamense]KAF5485112.1 Mitochondrial import inner membrane translocase subunit tim17 [Colletotrichum siamense]
MRTPVVTGNFGVRGGMYSTYDCAIKGIRQKADAWNAIGAGFITGGTQAIRGGSRAARTGAVRCAPLFAVIEGAGVGFRKLMADSTGLDVGSVAMP